MVGPKVNRGKYMYITREWQAMHLHVHVHVHAASVAQLVEHPSRTRDVADLNPAQGSSVVFF